jgi:hypothetical protein
MPAIPQWQCSRAWRYLQFVNEFHASGAPDVESDWQLARKKMPD